jgi:hypothetical protein
MPRKMQFRDLSELRHCYWELQWPTARIARLMHIDRSVVRRILKQLGLPRHTRRSANIYLATERTPEEGKRFAAKAHAARRHRVTRPLAT